jgi:hypothetical protein
MNTSSIKQLADESLALLDAIEEMDRQLFAAIEDLSQDNGDHGRFHAGIQHERNRVLTLISVQLDLLKRGDASAPVLEALSRQVREVQP